jgi:hypothetical protein
MQRGKKEVRREWPLPSTLLHRIYPVLPKERIRIFIDGKLSEFE